MVRYWRGYLSGVRCKWFAYGPADATATPSSLARVKSRMVYFSGAALPRLPWKKRPLCSSSSSSSFFSCSLSYHSDPPACIMSCPSKSSPVMDSSDMINCRLQGLFKGFFNNAHMASTGARVYHGGVGRYYPVPAIYYPVHPYSSDGQLRHDQL